MRIADLYAKKKPVISLEIFPPNPDYPLETIYNTLEQLRDLNPDYISVTYGAGGANRARTVEIAAHIKQAYQIETMAHLTCVGHSPEEIDEMGARLQENQIENVLALRGDPPRGQSNVTFQPGHFRYAAELIRYLRQKSQFCIGAAAYAEGHVECQRWQDDWNYLREKVEAGVDFLVTQLYFDNRVFYNFKENLLRMGLNLPVAAGIMPVLESKQIRRMVYLSGASIPARLLQLLDKYADNPADFEKAGIEYAINQMNDLLANGVEGIHYYTMNRAEQTRKVFSGLAR
ncbi:5,10-methylenetetrahydrofolate reductase (NAD(P)) [Hydrogenispora ethanolica]|jgi:methylenetetrahydrofolate reductase (NADPH)|uniref:Methylenetetrahydrofolate reductase n=1 Tax=Hydrogenispora ethanolica TaxID=1082276 RepID=A0A4R1RUL1_HYDET|nr:methylenetetrahydrofolate reductase [NAD(P)H] [Hydrogenispora ethanolica]TCL70064.1 5,10-methylenetetrahydrofolate reductase (NAD(P)) [Hydrogenispora ethanolica]